MISKGLALPGDLVFYRVTPQSSWRAKVIAFVQLLRGEGSGPVEYGHVAVLDLDVTYKIEAVWPRVRRVNMDWDNPDIEICRVAQMPWMGESAAGEAFKYVGCWYNIGQMFLGVLSLGRGKICTTLARAAYAPLGIVLAESSGRFLSPNELREDARLWAVNAPGK